MEKYLVIEPCGEMRWIQTERKQLMQTFYAAIGCDCFETVRTMVPDVILIVDESGKVKTPPQEHNERASQLYRGYMISGDDIAGPAILASIGPVNGEMDIVPLNDLAFRRLTALGIITD